MLPSTRFIPVATVLLLLCSNCTDVYSALELDIDIPNYYPLDTGAEVKVDTVPPQEEILVDTGPECAVDEDCLQFFDDLNVCQVAACDSAKGICVKGNLKNWLPCDDGDPCSDGSICHDGQCTGGVLLECDDQNQCTTDECSAEEGGCVYTETIAPCDDGNGCTENDKCLEGECQGQPAEDCTCDDDVQCAPFDDNDLCNGTLACIDDTCQIAPESVVQCDNSLDGPCEETFCAPNLGQCVTTALDDGTPCSDGIGCTISDQCQDGICSGTPVPCECEIDDDCIQFDDADLCNGVLVCQEQSCVTQPESPVVCENSDDTPCSKSVCVPSSGNCETVPTADGTGCSDDDPCTTPDLCEAGECLPGEYVCGAICGDGDCVQEDGENCTNCPDDCGQCPAGPCCEAHDFPGCDNDEVESCVCEQDPYCCEVAWDAVCVSEVDESACGYCIEPICGDGTCAAVEDCEVCPVDCGICPPGPCCLPVETPGCEDPEIEQCVCQIDPYCCDVVWDQICAEEVEEYDCGWCGNSDWCGNDLCEATEDCQNCPDDCGDCPGCNANDECEGFLGEDCDNCPQDCGPCPVAPCCEPHDFPGCDDPEINDCVCAEDEFCCTVMWDGICVSQVNDFGCGFCDIPPCGNDICDPGTEDCINCPEDCGPCPVGDCCKPHDFPGCDDPIIMLCVCSNDFYCCDIEWDELCVQSVEELQCGNCDLPPECENGVCEETEDCESCPDDCGPCPPVCDDGICELELETCLSCPADCGNCKGECCEPNDTPGCNTPEIAACVCELDSFCCEVWWDDVCVEEVEQFGCAVCVVPPVCGDGICDPDDTCYNCEQDCGPCQGACCEPNETPGCDEPEVMECVCDSDPFCCEIWWDEACVAAVDDMQCGKCQMIEPGPCCETGEGPGCLQQDCQDLVCQFNPFCCDFQWDGLCVLLATDMCEECGGSYPGECCQPHLTPGCNDPEIEACVCEKDPVCCDQSWDDICAQEVLEFGCDSCGLEPICGDHLCEGGENCFLCPGDCGSCPGDCCEPQDGPGCEQLETMMCVCDIDPFCCLVQWDEVCVEMVELEECGLCQPEPWCGDHICDPDLEEDCQTCPGDCGPCPPVCGDDHCDGAEFDENCQTCPEDCGECAGPCCEAHPDPTCDDPEITECVCSQMPECCSLSWPDNCVELVEQGGCGICPGGEGSCCEAHDTPGCENVECETMVCDLNLFCCGVVWDPLCVSLAKSLCPDCAGEPQCGDNLCTVEEDCETCPEDCGPCPPECGDGNCDGFFFGENCETCPEDCGECPFCGDGNCLPEDGETCLSCKEDCGPCPWCGDHICSPEEDEDCSSCPADCGQCPFCGDGDCLPEDGETCDSCPDDCGPCPFCGDEQCDPDLDEDCKSCPADCGPCPDKETCCEAHPSPGCDDPEVEQCVCALAPNCCEVEWDPTCPMIAQAVCQACQGAVCGDEVCDPTESCLTCPQDCGACELEPCCEPHASPGCIDPEIMQCVCFIHPACCQQAWTDQCVAEIKLFGCGDCN